MERLILNRIKHIVDVCLPHEHVQAGFREGRSTTDQVTLLTQDIEDGFQNNIKSRVVHVLIDLSATYITRSGTEASTLSYSG
jgi:hypothetical protein